MDDQTASALIQRYPALLALRSPERTSFMAFGFDGWAGLIDGLCATLVDHGSSASVSQIKEKFGGLRFHAAPVDEHEEGAIDFAEEASFRVCEITGHPGQLYRFADGRLKTVCAEIAAQSGAVPASAEPHAGMMELKAHYARIVTGPIDVPAGWRNVVEQLLFRLAWSADGMDDPAPRERQEALIIKAAFRDGAHLIVETTGTTDRESGMIACACQLARRTDPETGILRLA